MAGEALFIGWGAVVRGREQQALQVFQESMQYYGGLQQEGRIESFDVYLLAPHGGDLNGFVILRGEPLAEPVRGAKLPALIDDGWITVVDATGRLRIAKLAESSRI